MQETRKSIAATVVCLLTYTAISPSLADPINLLREFRPIGGVGNNLANPNLDVVPGSPELNLAPLNFGPGTNDPLVSGPKSQTHQQRHCRGNRGERSKRRDNRSGYIGVVVCFRAVCRS